MGYGIESVFGFGGSVVTFLLLTLLIPAKEAIAFLPVFALFGSLLILVSDLRSVKWSIVLRISAISIPPLVLGVYLMKILPDRALAVFVLFLIIFYGITQTLGITFSIPGSVVNTLYAIAGFVIGATSIGVLYIPPASEELPARRSFRASLGLLWFITAAVRIPFYMAVGILSPVNLLSSLAAVPFLALAIYGGYYLHRKIPEHHYHRYVGGAVTVFGIASLVTKLL